MMNDPSPRFTDMHGTADYERALDTLLAQPGRCLRIFDRQLGISYNSVQRERLLKTLLSSSRLARIQIVVHETATLQRDCPRLMNLLRQYSNALSIHQTGPPARSASDPFALLDDRHYVHRFHCDGPRGVLALDDPAGMGGLRERFEQIWEASWPAASATTLGL